jgi:hypothetical protein
MLIKKNSRQSNETAIAVLFFLFPLQLETGLQDFPNSLSEHVVQVVLVQSTASQ